MGRMSGGPRALSKDVSIMLLGSGELGKEVAIEAARLGVTVIAADRYPGAPAMQVADRSVVIDMLDPTALTAAINDADPTIVVPEIEAIAVEALAVQERSRQVVPTARGVALTMNREGIRRLAAQELGLPTSQYRFASSQQELRQAASDVGFPCVVKPIMSSSGKGQSLARNEAELETSWEIAQTSGRTHGTRVIVESFIEFDYEITLLTVRAINGTFFCPPIGHVQVDGDYRKSWQPHGMSQTALAAAQDIARRVTDNLGGWGIFGVELFVRGDQVYFSEVSPRPHDTGLVTLVSQDCSEFALHVRAILGLPVDQPHVRTPGASVTINATSTGNSAVIDLADALAQPATQARVFGKAPSYLNRRLGVVLATADDVEEAILRAERAADRVVVDVT